MNTTDRPTEFLDLRQLIASGNQTDRDLAAHLLEKVYQSLYLMCFPNPDQQETLEQYRQRLFDPQQPKPQPITHFLVAGEKLTEPDQYQIHGFLIFEYYRHSNCVLFAYLGVAATERGKRWSTDLLAYANRIIQRDYKLVVAIFAEIRIPNSTERDDSKLDTERLEIMRRLEAFRVPIRYVQPALQPGGRPAKNLMLVTFSTRPNTIPVPDCSVLETYLTEFYNALGVSCPKKDRYFRISQRYIKELAKAKWPSKQAQETKTAKRIQKTYGLGFPVAEIHTARSTEVTGRIVAEGWVFVISWWYLFEQQAKLASTYSHCLLEWLTHYEWIPEFSYFPEYAEPVVLLPLVSLVLRLGQGIGIFGMIVFLYHTPFFLLLHSTFQDDQAPEWTWHPRDIIFRCVELVFYYANIISLSSVRRFLYIATHPFIELEFWHAFNMGPDRLYKKTQLYIEAELFIDQPKTEDESRKAFGRRVADLYAANLRKIDKNDTPVANCKTCFDVLGRQKLERIEKYFRAQIKVHRDPTFLTQITFDRGYLAPAFLVSGPLSEYDEDWTKIVNAYPEKIDRKGDPLGVLPDLRRLQSFIWDCWVQWGPSVPICNSDDWTSGEIALQFGYGDENNSMPLRCYSKHPDTGERVGHRFQKWEDKVKEIRSTLNPSDSTDNAWAWPVTVTGKLRWLGRGERNSKLCKAQNDTATEYSTEGWMVFDVDVDENKQDADAKAIKQNPDAPLYFSAYVWVLVAICRSTDSMPDEAAADSSKNAKHSHCGYRLIESEKDEWRCLIPFFQHGNIAEPSVYEAIKKELASKTVECLLNEVRKAKTSGVDWLHFAFVSAYDDNGDNSTSTNVAKSRSASIRELMVETLDDREAHSVAKAEIIELRKRIHLNADALDELTACRIPHVVRTYLDHVEDLSRIDEMTRASSPPNAEVRGEMGAVWHSPST